MTQQTLEQQVKNYMRRVVENHIDTGGWIVCTTLAEDAADEFPQAALDDCFEYALEVAHEYEAAHLHK